MTTIENEAGTQSMKDATITQDEFDRKRKHEHAGYGTPVHPDAEGVWWMYLDPIYGTTLVTGGRIA
jgi:hypothetical protein